MKKLAFFLGIAIAIFISAQYANATQTIDDALQVNSLKVGKQGSGGVTFFNGTIVNETTTDGEDNPVTFGDNVRIDGRVFRGSTAGTSDSQPFIINDNAEISGDLSVAGNISSGGSSMLKKTIYTGTFNFSSSGDIQMTQGDYTYYWKTVSIPEINVNNIPIVQVYTGMPTEGPGLYPDVENSFVNISYLLANFVVENGKVHILYRVNNDGDDFPIYDSENYKIVVIN